jgi:hypothetical protein
MRAVVIGDSELAIHTNNVLNDFQFNCTCC